MKKTFFPLFLHALLLCGLAGCSENSVSPNVTAVTGKGGSMARFAVTGNHLYTVDHTKLHLFDISTPANPEKTKEVPLGFGIETIFPFQDKLFIGAQNGIHILSIQNPQAPQQISSYQHVVSCDPVVTDGKFAYVTLSVGSDCRVATGTNELQIIDLQNLANPVLRQRYSMTNPKGLAIDGNLLFVCDDGLKVYDASNIMALQLKHHFKITAYDVILKDGNVLVSGSDGFYQYRYTGQKIELLSKIPVQPAT